MKIKYEYNGSALDRMLSSYGSDVHPFRTAGVQFPDRVNEWAEINLLERLMFPHYYNNSEVVGSRRRLGRQVNELGHLLYSGIAPYLGEEENLPLNTNVGKIVSKVIDSLPVAREQLKADVKAAFDSDPAVNTYSEIIRAYPGFKVIMVHRLAHSIYQQGARSYARELSERAHSSTGIDIHPGADIGEGCFIDHGTGTVIGETSIVGNNFKGFQGTTLGALTYRKKADGKLDKSYKRHPTIGDGVTIGEGTSIWGDHTIGSHSKIGARCWIEQDVAPHTRIYVAEHPVHEVQRKDTRQLVEVR